MGRYITIAEANTYIGTSGEDAVIATLIDWAEALFDTMIGSETGLLTSEKTEVHPVNYRSFPGKIFWLKTWNPTVITTVNSVAVWTVNVNYTIDGTRLELKDAQPIPTTFPYRFTVVYTSGYADISEIPKDIKTCIKQLVSGYYKKKDAEWISSFRQDLLQVNFSSDNILDTIADPEQKSAIKAVINKYTVPQVI